MSTHALALAKELFPMAAWLRESIDISRFPYPCRLIIEVAGNGCGVDVQFRATVKDVHTGQRITTANLLNIDGWYLLSFRQDWKPIAANLILRFVCDQVLHEIQECFFVDGAQLKEPHHPKRIP